MGTQVTAVGANGGAGVDTAAGTAVVIEDDEDIRALVQAVLEQRGLQVFSASSGAEGLELVRERQPVLVTLDLGLPDIDGFEVCRRIRSMSDAYVIMLSARADEVDQLVGLEIGADDYITKPFSPRDLRARVGAMLRRPRGGAPAAAGAAVEPPAPEEAAATAGVVPPEESAHRLTVDVESRVAVLDGEELTLTRTEFDLLAALFGQPRRVWTREALLRTVWKTEWVKDTHLVEVHVGNLRRKLGDEEWIRTVWGVGYRFGQPELAEMAARRNT
ncbi:DNA-binding response OmpR family regulator [Oryzihumus leptocrescens]|uniref:DNA-binding response OmpR family regulator n=1 Tax=Oryzihumus leptocrescens TaxID=297536 RepID=A0A542Z7K6_9MICO|nr:DNA-binding response OmpR family regulator [Oryzihumus leptocrescens]